MLTRHLLDVERLSEPHLTLPPDLTYDEWAALAPRLGALVRFSHWALGDFLLYGDDHFGELVSQAEIATGLDYTTLANARRTARAFPPARRHALLSFSHHVEVAALAPAEADELLDLADPPTLDGEPDSEPRLSVRELRIEAQLRQSMTDERDPALMRYGYELLALARELMRSKTPDTICTSIEHVLDDVRNYLRGH